MRRCRRDDASGGWPCVASPPPPPQAAAAPATTRFRDFEDKRLRKLAPSLVVVSYQVPFRVDGVHGETFVGAGLVVDTERGLVVVDRDTLPVALGDATLTFAGSLQVPGEVLYIHPEHNLAILRYDPALLGETPVRSAELRDGELESGDEVWLVGMTESQQLVSERTRVSRVEFASLPLTSPPRFRETNVELVALSQHPSTVGGVLADERGRVLALWASFSSQGSDGPQAFFAGIPVSLLRDVMEPLAGGRSVAWRSIGVEVSPLSLAAARNRGLSEDWARRLEDHDPSRRRVLAVVRRAADVPAAHELQEGDLLLAVDGKPVTRVRELESSLRGDSVVLTLLRDGEAIERTVPTHMLPGGGTGRALLWAGALLQEPHRAVATQRGIPREGVYVVWFAWGSPAHRYGLGATRRIVAVDGQATPDLDRFLAAVGTKPDRGAVRLHTEDLEGRRDVITLKLDLQYWPTSDLRREPAGWVRHTL